MSCLKNQLQYCDISYVYEDKFLNIHYMTYINQPTFLINFLESQRHTTLPPDIG